MYKTLASPLKPKSLSTFTIGENSYYTFYAWNIFAALLHGVNAFVMLYFYYDDGERDQLYDLTTSYGSWKQTNLVSTYNNVTNTTTNATVAGEDPKFQILTNTKTVWSSYSLNWTIFTFHLLSFVFQLGAVIPAYGYVERIVSTGRHPLRFIEYSLSASLMLLCIALLTGVRDILVLGGIVVLTMATQILGLVAEYQFPGFNRNVVHGVAWACILVAYSPIIIYYNVAVNMNDVSPPDFVVVIVTVQALLFLSFGFVQLIQFYYTNAPIIGFIGRQAEISYIFLSIVAKSLLGWLIYVNLIMNADQIVSVVVDAAANATNTTV